MLANNIQTLVTNPTIIVSMYTESDTTIFSQFDISFTGAVLFFIDVEISSISQKVGLVMLVSRLLKLSNVAKSCGCQRRRVFKHNIPQHCIVTNNKIRDKFGFMNIGFIC